MSSPQQPTTMENLPDDVLSNILIRLLAKQLAQMRCISKFFNVFLSHPSFISAHLDRSIHFNDEFLLLFRQEFSFHDNPFTVHRSCDPDLELTNFIKRPNLKSRYTYGRIIGSVNGLICFSYVSDVCIWNPSLSAVLTLPPSSIRERNSDSRKTQLFFRFGFDPKTDDYKVVKLLVCSNSTRLFLQAEVYSMRNGIWNLTQKFPSRVHKIYDQFGVCVDGQDGHVHWVGYTDLELKGQTIVSFDLGEETFCEMPFPSSILNYNVYCRPKFLGVLGGKLCVMAIAKTRKCVVWVMDEYGVAESWVKKHVFSPKITTIPLGFTSRNEFLFEIYNYCVAIYDPIAAKIKTFKKLGSPRGVKIVQYVDSLVWVAPSTKFEKEHQLDGEFSELLQEVYSRRAKKKTNSVQEGSLDLLRVLFGPSFDPFVQTGG